MRRSLSLLTLLVVGLAVAAPVPKADPKASWVGSQVVLKKYDTYMTVPGEGGKPDETVLVDVYEPMVIREADTRIEVYSNGKVGWLDKSEVVRAADGVGYFTKLLEESEQSDSYFRRAACHKLARKLDDALADMNRAMELSPSWALHVSRGSLYADMRRYDEALADYDEAVNQAPNEVFPYRLRGWGRMAAGKFDAALEDLNKANEMAPDAWAYADAAWAYLGKREYKRAAEQCDKSLALNPKHVPALVRRGEANLELGEVKAAVKDCTAAVDLDPRDVAARFGRVRGRLALGEYREAALDLTAAEKVDPKSADVLGLRAWVLATCPDAEYRDGAKAVKLAAAACEKTDWKAGKHLATLAAASAEAGQFDDAVKWQTKAVEDKSFVCPDGKERLALFGKKRAYRQEPTAKK